jgi:predicted phosphodiesterase
MIYVTGDTHGGIDIRKLNTKNFPDSKMLCRNDYVIVAGDFGFIWDGSNQDKYWLNWFRKKNFTTLFVDGNHENFDLLNQYPIEIWNGGKIHRINDSVLHLMRGQVFNISNNIIFTFGGAKSSDIEYRKEGKSWWKDEMPTDEEYAEGIRNLELNGYNVDYIISHTCPGRTLNIINERFNKDKEITKVHEYFNIIEEKVHFKHWYFGHSHQDSLIKENQTLVYNQVIRII